MGQFYSLWQRDAEQVARLGMEKMRAISPVELALARGTRRGYI